MERKREEIRRETKILISSKTTETMKCPDCGKVFNNLINYVRRNAMTRVTGVIYQVTGIYLINFEVAGHITWFADFVFLKYVSF